MRKRGGSSPSLGTILHLEAQTAAQGCIPKAVTAGKTAPSLNGDWRSLVAHLLWEQRVVGSNPTSPTISQGPRHSETSGFV